jgi:hypothetical protein
MKKIENIILLADINSEFSLNILSALKILSPDSKFFIVSKIKSNIILPKDSFFIDFDLFQKDNQLIKTLDTTQSLAVAIHATNYAIELDLFEKLKKLVIFTGDDTLFKRSSNRALTQRFNTIFETVDAVGFCSFFHQQEYIAFLKSPALLIPYGYRDNQERNMPSFLTKRKVENILKNSGLNNGNYNVTIIPSANVLTTLSKITELETFLNDFDASDHINYHIICTKAEKKRLDTFLSEKIVNVPLEIYCLEEKSEMDDLLVLTEMTISFKEIYSVDGAFNLFLKKNHPILSYFVREYSDFENIGSHVLNFESVEGLAKKIVAILPKLNDFPQAVDDGYTYLLEKHSHKALQSKLKKRIEQIFSNELHPCHEDTDFLVDNDKPMIIFTHFAQIEGHRHSARPMRVRAMRDNFRKKGHCFTLMGEPKVLTKKFNYLKHYIQEAQNIDLVYEESLSSPHPIESQHSIMRVELRELLKKYQINYSVFFRDMYQAYPSFEKILKELSFQRFNVLRGESLNMFEHITKMYTPSNMFSNEMFLKGMIESQHIQKLTPLPPAINPSFQIYNNTYISGSDENIKIVYTGGMGEFYNFRAFVEALLLCKTLPLEFHLYIKKEELDKSRHIYGNELDKASNVFIHRGSFTELAINMNFDLGMSLFDDDNYRKMAAPVKVFDYLSLNMPVLAGCGTEAGAIVSQNNVGFSIENSVEDIVRFFMEIVNNRGLLKEKQENIAKFVEENSWEKRVEQVIKDANAI